MSNFNLYSRGDRIFGWANAILLGLFVLSTLYPFIYVLSVSLSSGPPSRLAVSRYGRLM